MFDLTSFGGFWGGGRGAGCARAAHDLVGYRVPNKAAVALKGCEK